MERQELVEMLRYDAAQLQRVVNGDTAELRLSQVAPEIIRHLDITAAALERS